MANSSSDYFFLPPVDPNFRSVELLCGKFVTPEPINWLWNGYLARGKFHVLAGAPGTGKTTLALTLAAIISSGGCFPDGTRCEPAGVIIWSAEDDIKDTLLPRLIASGADMENIFFVEKVIQNDKARNFDPAVDMRALWIAGAKASVASIGLVIIDPIVNAVAGDSHKNGEVRRALEPLVDLCAKLKCAAIGISHFSKGTTGRDPLERVTGSLAFGALARVVMVTTKITEDGVDKRIFCRAKSNIGLDGGGFEYEIEQTELEDYENVFTTHARFGEAVNGSASELLGESNEDSYGGDDCIEFLSALLKGNKLTAKEVFIKTKENGFSEKQVRSAGKKLNVHIHREGFGKGALSYWSMVNINIDSILSQTLPKN